MACNPAIRITRLTTIAKTGRLTNRSVNFTLRSSKGKRRTELTVVSLICSYRLAFVGLRTWIIFRLDRVVHFDRSTVAEPEDTRTYNFVSWVNAGGDSNLIAS